MITASNAKLEPGRLLINGQWTDGEKKFDTVNPATGEILGTVPKLGAAETRAAIDAANKAFPAWSKRTGKERAAILRRWFDLMMENQDDLARLMTLEQGTASATIRVPAISGRREFSTTTGMFFSIAGSSVEGCSTLAPK